MSNVLNLPDAYKPILREMCAGISANACLLITNKIYFDFIIFFLFFFPLDTFPQSRRKMP